MPSNNPKLSVLLPAYNAEKYIQKAIDSILDQSFEDFELLIADDGSNDRTRELINSFTDERIKHFHNKLNIGKSATINNLYGISKGEFITIHDADDWSSKDRFAKQISFLEVNPDHAMCGTSFFHISQNGEILNQQNTPTDYEKIRKEIYQSSQFHGPTLLFRNHITNKIGGLYRNLKIGEDVDFTMRVIENFKATNLPEALYYYRVNKYSITKSYKQDIESKIVDRELLKKLAEQRKLTGTDVLMREEKSAYDELIVDIKQHYSLNKDFYLDEYVGHLISYNLHWTALKAILYRTLKDKPSLKKGKLFFYVILKKLKLK